MSFNIKAKLLFARFISLLVLLCILISSIYSIVFNTNFYKRQFTRLDIPESTGIKLNALVEITDELLSYIKGGRSELSTIKAEINGEYRQVFNKTETDHMSDVRNLFNFSVALRDISFLLIMLLTAILALCIKNFDDILKLFAESYIFICKALGVFTIVLAITAIINFTLVWDIFHYIFFRNDLWMLDPDTDIMILMLPEQLFSAAVFRIILRTLAAAVILYIPARKIIKDKKKIGKNRLETDDLLQKND